jgi:hypothetical protein
MNRRYNFYAHVLLLDPAISLPKLRSQNKKAGRAVDAQPAKLG